MSSSRTEAPACWSAERRSTPLMPLFARAVAMTLSPCCLLGTCLGIDHWEVGIGTFARMARTRASPRPEEQPVTNQTS